MKRREEGRELGAGCWALGAGRWALGAGRWVEGGKKEMGASGEKADEDESICS